MTDYDLQFDPKQRVLLITFGKILTESVFLECYNAVGKFAAGIGGCMGIADLTGVEHIPLSIKFIRTIAALPPAIPPGTTRVVVAPDRLSYGLSRMFQGYRDGMQGEFQVARTRSDAFRILGLASAEFEPVEP